MSLTSGIRGFSVSMYGQSGVVMDWFGLNDPFTQQVPLKITNAYSGTLWFQGSLVNPRSGYFSYSGIQMGSVGSGASTNLLMTWDTGVSGWIASSSPITDTLTLNLTTFTSSNYGPSYSSGNFTVFNTLFSRWSGVIKVYGDIYNNDQPTPTLAQATGGTYASGQQNSYAISYIMSGWESDVGAAANLTLLSGQNAFSVSWNSVTGATQYCLWRWSGTGTNQQIGNGSAFPGAVQLVALQATTSFTDTNVAAIVTRFRHRDWEANQIGGGDTTGFTTADNANFLSSPQSRLINVTAMGITGNTVRQKFTAHSFMLSQNLSGNLVGPWYIVFHLRYFVTSPIILSGIGVANGINPYASGTFYTDSTIVAGLTSANWYRMAYSIPASGLTGSPNNSGYVTVQCIVDCNGTTTQSGFNFDDVFVVAIS